MSATCFLRISAANIGPNRFHQNRTVSWLMSIPRSAKRSAPRYFEWVRMTPKPSDCAAARPRRRHLSRSWEVVWPPCRNVLKLAAFLGKSRTDVILFRSALTPSRRQRNPSSTDVRSAPWSHRFRFTHSEQRGAKRSSTLRSDSGYLKYIITTRRMTSGELLKYRNGLLMTQGYHGQRHSQHLV